MFKDKEALEAAKEVANMTREGRTIIRQAMLTASEQMIRLVPQLRTKGAKIEALKAHGLYMGLGMEFMEETAPQALEMKTNLMEQHRQAGVPISEGEIDILVELYLAKIFREIDKALRPENE